MREGECGVGLVIRRPEARQRLGEPLLGEVVVGVILSDHQHQAAPHAASIRMMFADDLSDEALDAALSAMKRASSPFSLIQFRGLGGAMAQVGNDATAFAHRELRFFVAIIGLWLDASEDPAVHEAWTAALWRTFHLEGNGVYVNFLEVEGPDRVREAYPPATYARLAAIKRRYDPGNLFRFNQNVPPTPKGS
jgi:Berberine and berberine like